MLSRISSFVPEVAVLKFDDPPECRLFAVSLLTRVVDVFYNLGYVLLKFEGAATF